MFATVANPRPTHARLEGTNNLAFIHTGTELELPAGTVLIEQDLLDHFYVLLDGEIAITSGTDANEEVILAGASSPDDQSPVLIGTPPTVTGARVLRTSRFLYVEVDVYMEHIAGWSPFYTIIVGSLAGRVHNAVAMLRQQEKLAALGKLSAGLAHELNNPASAAHRAADHMRTCIETLATTDDRQPAELVEIERRALARRPARPVHDPLLLAEREEELAAWLDARGIPDGWRIAASLAEAGLDSAWLDAVAAQVNPDALGTTLVRFEARLRATGLLDEIEQSTDRIAELVGALKSYAYRDQAPVQEVDVHQGLENTLVILNHKLRDGITVTRDYEPALPRITAFGGELNQVWTNLIDNAIDALQGHGRISIRTACQDDHVVVEIIDDGPGIPAEVQPHIFAPFITTKAQGEGVGIGLHTAYTIVVHRHHGKLTFTSEPGRTSFRVHLPVKLVDDVIPGGSLFEPGTALIAGQPAAGNWN